MTRPTQRLLCVVIAAMIAGPVAAAAQEGHRFPVSAAVGGRHLEDAEGRPFLLHGDTAWSLIADLDREDADRYLRDRAERGFNTILASLIEHRFARNAPANAYGDAPFLTDGDYTTPNERYFAHAEWILHRAQELGLLVLLTPSYIGIGGGEQGWYAVMARNGPKALEGYGRYLGRRFAALDNIVWVHGGDWDPPNRRLVTAIVDGIEQTDPTAVHTFHGAPESVVADVWPGATWLMLDTVYTYGPVLPAMLAQRARRTGRPFILIESAYENEQGITAQGLRTQAYHAALGGGTGQLFGNNPVWHFDGPGLHAQPAGWRESLDSTGARDMTRLKALLDTLPWWRLEPDIAGGLVTGGVGTGKDRAAAARTPDGQVAVVYLPSQRTVAVDLGRMAGPLVQVRWHDPTGARTSTAAETLPAEGTVRLAPPGRNGAGDGDWVLLLEGGLRPGEHETADRGAR